MNQPPDRDELHRAATAFLAHAVMTQGGLVRILDRRIDLWAKRAGATTEPERFARLTADTKLLAREVVAALVAEGAAGDLAMARRRALKLMRAGRSHRAVLATLQATGCDGVVARAALSDDSGAELAAAAVFARKRRIGPFRQCEKADHAGRRRELAVLGRAGFPTAIASRVLELDRGEAETLIGTLQRH